MKILLDNGHGENTPGKRSPDGKFREYLYAREIAEAVERELKLRGHDAERIVHENIDVPLAERARRVNEICGRYGTSNVVLISIHCNAAGDGSNWTNATGWAVYTTKGVTKSDKLSECLYNAASCHITGQKLRRDYSDGDSDWEENFYILRKTKCPAVLVENFFMDNKNDVSYLLSSEGKKSIINTIVDGVIQYIEL